MKEKPEERQKKNETLKENPERQEEKDLEEKKRNARNNDGRKEKIS